MRLKEAIEIAKEQGFKFVAVDDARHQALHLIKIWRSYKSE